MIKTITKYEEVLDFAWDLSKDDLYATYNRYSTIDAVKEALIRGIERDNRKVIAYYKQDLLVGVCIYSWIHEENYAQTHAFLIKEDYDKVADQFIEYMRKELPRHELLVGVPLSNKNANNYLAKRNFNCDVASTVTALYNLGAQHGNEYEEISTITKSNFDKYVDFHDKFAIPYQTYYTSKNLKKELDIFRIFVYKHDGVIRGSIFIKKNDLGTEIFGLYVDEEYKKRGIEEILLKASIKQLYKEFGKIDEIIYFVDENCPDDLNSALVAGFQIKDTYRCYSVKF